MGQESQDVAGCEKFNICHVGGHGGLIWCTISGKGADFLFFVGSFL